MDDSGRIVVTGLGCLSPLGSSVEDSWAAFKAGRSAIGPITTAPLDDLRFKVGAEITYDVASAIPEDRRAMLDRFSVLALGAAHEAAADAGLTVDAGNAFRVGSVMGVGVCGWEAIEEQYRRVLLENVKRASLFTVPRVMPSAPASQMSMALGLRGPAFGVTSACASSNHAILTAVQMIRSGQADVVLAGGSEAPLVYGIMKAWEALRIVARDTCRPFCNTRGGLVLGEGAGVIVLERADHALARGARIRAELAGGGMTADAADLFSPAQDGPEEAMRLCLASAGLDPSDVDYINAHGTGTRINDVIETKAIRAVFGRHADALSVSSTKSMHGHTLGAAGALELIACIKAIEDGVVPPTANYLEPDPECDLDVTPNVAREREVSVALSNAFAFGGLNAVIAVRRYPN